MKDWLGFVVRGRWFRLWARGAHLCDLFQQPPKEHRPAKARYAKASHLKSLQSDASKKSSKSGSSSSAPRLDLDAFTYRSTYQLGNVMGEHAAPCLCM